MQGIVIRTYPSGEADLVLKVLSASGEKLSLFARGARQSKRRFSGGIDLFDSGKFETKRGRGTLVNVTSFVPQRSLPNLRQDLNKLSIATLLCESIDLIVPEDNVENEDLHQTFYLGLQAIDEAADVKSALRACFFCLATTMRMLGMLDEKPTAASSKNLLALLNTIETYACRELLSKEGVQMVIRSLE